MKKNLILSLLFMIVTTSITLSKISTVCIDVTAIFTPNSMKASGYIGKIDSLRYIASVGSKPSQEALFKALMPMPAKSKITTYNDNLAMPLIFSDWLATIETNTIVKDKINKYFSTKNISDIEKKVLFAIVSMMLTPTHLADIQDINKQVIKILEKLKSLKIKLYLTGNWAHIQSLKAMYPEVFSLFAGIFVSGDLHLIKPDQTYYTTVIEKINVTQNEIVWIETEPKFIAAAQSMGLQIASYANKNSDALTHALKRFGISV